MTPTRWQEIERIYHAALECSPTDRAAFLDEVCKTDRELRGEVESLLAQSSSGGAILDQPAWNLDSGETDKFTVQANSRLGPYELKSRLGAGGMGMVFLAEDTRLGRKVAVKVSRIEYSERFQREARAIAALNHPNICTLYDVGPTYMVMELLDGQTLKERIACGKLTIEETLLYGRQIAGALAEAHTHGIVHRDLKPANVMLTRTGLKVLDFGLAKVVTGAGETLTESHVVMGTPAYMAPEQVKGETAGPAADLFAFGLVLYEMAEGKLPMRGVSIGNALAGDTATKIPPLSDTSSSARALHALIRQLLDPVAQKRPQSAGEVRDRLDSLALPNSRKRTPLVAAVIAIVALASAGIWWTGMRNSSSSAPIAPSRITKLTSYPGDERDPALSPDGRSVAFSWNEDRGDTFDIYVIPIGGQTPVRLTQDHASDTSPVWSPDGRQIAFLRFRTLSNGSLVVIPSQGGSERVLLDVKMRTDFLRGTQPLLTWTPDGKGIVYSALDPESGRVSLFVTDLQTAAARRLFPSDDALGNAMPALTRDGKWLAYAVIYGPVQRRLFVRPLAPRLQVTGEASPVSVPGGTPVRSPMWAPDGKHLFFSEGPAIFEWDPQGGAKRIYLGSGMASMSAVWGPGKALRIVTADLDHTELRMIPLQPGGIAAAADSTPFAPSTVQQLLPEFSPDGKRVAFLSYRSGASEVWIADGNGQNPVQLSHLNARVTGFPRWSGDGKRIAFHAWLGTKPQIMISDVEQSLGKPGPGATPVTDAAFGFFSPTWSADQKYLYVDRFSTTRCFRIPVDGGAPEDLFECTSPKVSSDGHRIMYGKEGHLGIFSRSLDGDPAANPEEKLAEDYRSPGGDLNPFQDGLYYVSWNGATNPRGIRFYSYAQKKSIDVAKIPGPIGGSTPGLTVSPDRRHLVFSQLTGSGTDLTLIEFQ